MSEIMERPTHNELYGFSNRVLVRYWRRCAAWDMAARKGEPVTVDAYESAYDLLNRCIRWALAQQRHDESETSYNHDKYWYVHEGELLYARMEQLQNEVEEYGCTIACCGYFCQNVYPYDFEHHVITGNGLLYFFD